MHGSITIAVHRSRRGGCPSLDPPPPKTKVTIGGKNETYYWENLVATFGTQTFGSQTPSPSSDTSLIEGISVVQGGG